MSNESDDGGEAEAPPVLEGISYDQDIFNIENLPTRGNPTQLIRIVQLLSEGGGKSVEDINEEFDDFGQVYVSGNLKNGENLGFIDRTKDGVVLTDRGFELAFATEVNKVGIESDNDDSEDGEESENDESELEYEIDDKNELREFYRDGLREFGDYQELLKAVYLENDEELGDIIPNTVFLEILRTKFGIREENEATLKRRVTQLFYNLDAAGFGEHKGASGGYPVRFRFSENESIETLIEDLVTDVSVSGEDASDEDVAVGDVGETKKPTEDQEAGTGPEETLESQKTEEKSSLRAEQPESRQPEFGEDIEATSRNRQQTKNIEINVDVELDLESIDTAELEAKLDLLRDLMD